MAALKEAGTAVSEAAKKGVGKIKGLSKYGPAAKVVGRRAGVLLAVAEGTKAALSLLDDRLTRLARKSDNAAYIKAEAGKKAIFDRLRGQVNKLSPEQQAQLKQAVERLWAGQVHKDTGNAVFERQQVNAILQVALDQVTGKTGAEAAKNNRFALQQTRMGNAVGKAWEFGKKEDAHRDSFWGSAGGLATGRLRPQDFPEGTRGAVKFAQGAMNPFSTIGSVFTGEEFPWNRPRVDDVSEVQGLRSESRPQGILSQGMRKKEDMDDRAPPVPTEPVGLGGEAKPPTRLTYDDMIKSALKQAGYGPEQEARAAAYRGDLTPVLGGDRPAFNPYIPGGHVAMAGDVQALHMGTHEQIRDARQALLDQEKGMRAERQQVIRGAGLDWAAGQQGLNRNSGQITNAAQLRALTTNRNQDLRRLGTLYTKVRETGTPDQVNEVGAEIVKVDQDYKAQMERLGNPALA